MIFYKNVKFLSYKVYSESVLEVIIEIDCYYNLIRQFKGSILFAGFRKKNNEQFLEASLPLKNKRGEKNEKRKRE